MDCFEDLAEHLAVGGFELHELAQCTGEEMALHIVLDYAEGYYNDDVFGEEHWREVLPGPREDPDWPSLHELLFRDEDVLLLFDPSTDGIEDPQSEQYERWQFANLHPRAWFLPFAT